MACIRNRPSLAVSESRVGGCGIASGDPRQGFRHQTQAARRGAEAALTGTTLIHLLTIFFAVLTLAGIAAAAYRFRRRPVVWMMARQEGRATFHRNAADALDHAIAAARAAGRDAEAARLAPHLAQHRRALKALAGAAEFAPRR